MTKTHWLGVIRVQHADWLNSLSSVVPWTGAQTRCLLGEYFAGFGWMPRTKWWDSTNLNIAGPRLTHSFFAFFRLFYFFVYITFWIARIVSFFAFCFAFFCSAFSLFCVRFVCSLFFRFLLVHLPCVFSFLFVFCVFSLFAFSLLCFFKSVLCVCAS